ncbi:GNAT family N-acetyltransferase [Bosea sp. (in: a-proteobacteria)]|uniref:GNAT family N-acetyltransferase n=1 Tax=Bosea sp. (in: a-proteobacteria) TaxID=1871050 RepID=UPI002DDD4B82|nr:GNAT family N-acetyltransferase [Bosea sp. (in: a-proteobacteria)]HEV2512036.1 GNAT family N-acetyltransferase [Bosea sp. (in: a-proteobacteria)]
MRTRPAVAGDAEQMSAVLRAIIAAYGRERPSDPDFVLATYIAHPDRVACTVALDDAGMVVGFQSLRRARPGDPYGTPDGWGSIGTHVAPGVGRKGVGTTLFAVTLQAASEAGIGRIDAAIRDDNLMGLAYYEARGFRTHRTENGVVHKVYTVSES